MLLLLPTIGQAGSLETVKLLHFADMRGEFSTLSCQRGRGGTADFSSLLHLLESEKRSSEAIVLSPGNMLGNAPFFEFLLSQGEVGIATTSGMLARTGAEMVVPGLGEFSIPYRLFLEFLPDFERGGAHFRAHNVTCLPEAKACDLTGIDQILVVKRKGVRFAIIPLVGPQVTRLVNPDNVAGLKVEEPAASATAAAMKLKVENRADVVIALVNLEGERDPAQDTMKFLKEVRGVDVIVAGGLSDEEGRPLIEIARAGADGTVLVGSPRAPGHLGVVTLDLEKRGARWVVDSARATVKQTNTFNRVQAVSSLLSQSISEFCSLAIRVLGHGRVDPPMRIEKFARYVMEITRRTMKTDIAVLSVDSIKLDPDQALGGPLSVGVLYRAFARHEVHVLSVSGEDLIAFAAAYLADDNVARTGLKLFAVGLSMDEDGNFKVNERSINPSRQYKVGTSDFLASGGKGHLLALTGAARARRTPTGYFLREIVKRWFEKNMFVKEGEKAIIDLERNFESLWDLPLWEFSARLDAGFSNISIDNNAGYDETQLARSKFTGITGDGQLHMGVSTRDHNFTDFTKVQYAVASTGDEELDETQDLITEEITYSWTRFRNRYGKERPYIPGPVVKTKLETEFSQSEELDYRHLEWTGVAGIQWLFGSKANVGLGYGIRRELLDPGDTIHKGAEFYYEINALTLHTWNSKNTITLDSRFALFWSDWGTDNIVKGLGSTKLSLSILPQLAFSAGFDIFLYDEAQGALAWSLDTILALTLTFDSALQTF